MTVTYVNMVIWMLNECQSVMPLRILAFAQGDSRGLSFGSYTYPGSPGSLMTFVGMHSRPARK